MVDELEAVSDFDVESLSDVDTTSEVVTVMEVMLEIPCDVLLELNMGRLLLEERMLGVRATEDEIEWTLLDELVVELLMLLEDDVGVDGMLLDDLAEVMLDDNRLLLVDSTTVWLEDGLEEDTFDGTGMVLELELDRDELEDEAELLAF